MLADGDRTTAAASDPFRPLQRWDRLKGAGERALPAGGGAFDGAGQVEPQLQTFDLLGWPAFACNADSRVAGMNQSACRQTLSGHLLAVRGRYIAPIDRACREPFHSAIAFASATRCGPRQSLLARMADGIGEYARIDVCPVSASSTSSRTALVLVICRIPPSDRSLSIELLRTTFDLTLAEAEVALLLARAMRFPDIAFARSVSEHTVRTQSKTLFSKLDVQTQAELVYKLRAIAG